MRQSRPWSCFHGRKRCLSRRFVAGVRGAPACACPRTRLRLRPRLPRPRPRYKRARAYIAIGTTAVASISTFARSSISATTCTAIIAG